MLIEFLEIQARVLRDAGQLDLDRNMMPAIEAWVTCTDAGGDQVAAAEIAARDCLSCIAVFFMWTPCFMHQCHLGVETHLKCADEWVRTLSDGKLKNYFSTLAVVMNCWRGSGKQVYREWTKQFPGTSKCVKRVPPKCIGGRWGSVSSCESRLLSLDANRFKSVWAVVASSQSTRRRRPAKKDDDDDIDEAGAYSTKMNTWWTRATDAITLDEFFYPLVVRIISTQRAPTDHLLYWLQKQRSLRKIGAPAPLALLAWGKKDTLKKEFHAMLRPDKWEDVLDDIPFGAKPLFVEGIVAGCAMLAADFGLRVESRVLEYPAKLLLLAKCLPDVECKELLSSCLSVFLAIRLGPLLPRPPPKAL
eukprot:9488119-Pyramimonas_sp.AAC.1